jgi:hypothetical protein
MNGMAGVGGPALTVYATATGWPQAGFAATAQLSFFLQCVASLTVKGLPQLSVPALGALIVAGVAGLIAGGWLVGRVPSGATMKLMVGVAGLGALATIAQGLLAWLA